jgi:hypothetical protein
MAKNELLFFGSEGRTESTTVNLAAGDVYYQLVVVLLMQL